MEHYLAENDLEDFKRHDALKQLLQSAFSPEQIKIILVSFNTYVTDESKGFYLPAELGLTVFSIEEGILDNYCTLIDPKKVPSWWALEAFESAKKLDVPRPPFSVRFQEYSAIVAKIDAVLQKHSSLKSEPILACLEKETATTSMCLEWLYNQAGVEPQIQLIPLELLLPRLSAIGVACRAKRENQAPKDIVGTLLNENIHSEKRFSETPFWSLMGLRSSVWKSTPSDVDLKPCVKTTVPVSRDGLLTIDQIESLFDSIELTDLGCLYHAHEVENEDVIDYDAELKMQNGPYVCSLNITNQRAYFILSLLMANFNITPVKGQHYFDWDDRTSELNSREKLLAKWDIDYQTAADLSQPFY